jgi:hypothetical protein
VGKILAGCEEPDERPALLGGVVAHRAAEHRIADLERIEHGTLRDRTIDLDRHLAVDARQRS